VRCPSCGRRNLLSQCDCTWTEIIAAIQRRKKKREARERDEPRFRERGRPRKNLLQGAIQ